MYGTVDPGFPKDHTGIIDQVTGREIIRSIKYQVVVPDDLQGIFPGDLQVDDLKIAFRIQHGQPFPGNYCFKLPEILAAEKDLTLQVALGHQVVVEYSDRPNSTGTHVLQDRGSQSPDSDHQHP